MDDVLKLLLQHFSKHVTIALEVIHFLLFHFLNLLLHLFGIDFIIWVEDADMLLHLFNLFSWHDYLAVLLSCLDEGKNLAGI